MSQNIKNLIAGDSVTFKNKRSQNIHKATATLYYKIENISTGSTYYLPIEELEHLLFSGKVEIIDSSNDTFKVLYCK